MGSYYGARRKRDGRNLREWKQPGYGHFIILHKFRSDQDKKWNTLSRSKYDYHSANPAVNCSEDQALYIKSRIRCAGCRCSEWRECDYRFKNSKKYRRMRGIPY